MGMTINTDEATARSLQWLQSNIKDGLLLIICRAVLQRDEQALQAVCTQHFAGEYAKSEAQSLGCNRELASLKLSESLRMGYVHSRGGNRNRSGFVLICDSRKTLLYVMKDFDKEGRVVITGQVRQEQEFAALTLVAIGEGLIEAVETRLRET